MPSRSSISSLRALRDVVGRLARSRRGERVLRTLALAIVIAVGLVAFGAFASSTFRAGPARFTVEIYPAPRGRSIVALPPFGSVSAPTHTAPLALRVSLREVDIPALERLAEQGIPDEETLARYRGDFVRGVVRAGVGGLVAAGVAAAFVAWALRRRLRESLLAGVAGVLLPVALLAWTRADFDIRTFRSPTYRGAVAYAPALVDLVQRRASTVETLRRQVERTARDVAAYYRAPQSFTTGGSLPGTIRVLHVSDTHLDPVGFQLARDLAREFDVALVIDTGDIDLYGSRFEAAFVASEMTTGIPRVFVPGNHDSPAMVRALAALHDVRVLDESTTVVAGLRVLGVGELSAGVGGDEPDPDELRELARGAADALEARMRAGEPTPTLVAVHDPAMGRPFEGLVPLVISGHTHTPRLDERDGTWLENAGTTGGVHFNELRTDPHIPHSAAVLYFTASEPHRLVAVDQIEVYGTERSSSLKRTVTDPELLR